MDRYRSYGKKVEKNHTLHEDANWRKVKREYYQDLGQNSKTLFTISTISQNTGFMLLTPIKFMAVISYEMFIDKHVW